MKSSGEEIRNAIKEIKNRGIKLVFLEDGFIHSFGVKKKNLPLSICYDTKGIYYDYKSKSDLFYFIKKELTSNEKDRSKKIIDLWKEYCLSKYNFPNIIEPPKTPYILLIDQVYGDLSINYGGAGLYSFERMVMFALERWPDHKFIIKTHPDCVSLKKNGCIHKRFFSHRKVEVVSVLGQINKLIEFSEAVCVVSSQVGFEALIYEKEVHVFGKPFYSGLGLTIDHDRLPGGNEKSNISLEQLIFGALIKYQVYLDPRTKKICEIEEIIEYLIKNRKITNLIPENFQGVNLTPWKKRQINRYIYDPTGKKLPILKVLKKNIKNYIIWGKSKKHEKKDCSEKNLTFVEDGFVRSVGLGADLYSPLSLLFDDKGIHYDFSSGNNLEDLLQNMVLNNNQIIRSKNLIEKLKKFKISKYNLKSKNKIFFDGESLNREKILVLGQVETDNSIIYGVPNKSMDRTNYSLVKQCKIDYPNGYIIYKQHPDLEFRLRSKGPEEDSIKYLADVVTSNVEINDLFNIVDRVVVFTSLGGFEALIRGLPVTTYGFPFYSGWGLTDDQFVNTNYVNRRQRKLSLEELVYISLIEYPFYFSLKYNCLTEIENIIAELPFYKKNNKSFEQIIFKYWGYIIDNFRRNGIIR
tara:strand:- start:5611 stop:7518 length:1908 start_codon:yes stop_codon:yes gene_type:complete